MADPSTPASPSKYAPEVSEAEAKRQMRHQTAGGIPVEEDSGVAAAELTGNTEPGAAGGAEATAGSG